MNCGLSAVAFATEKTLVESDYFGIESGSKVNKIEKVGIIAYDSTHYTYRLLGDVVGKAFHDGMAFKK